MERLTKAKLKGGGSYMRCSETCPYDCSEICDCEEFDRLVDRLGEIEDILGDDYDLDRLSVLVNQRMTMREDVAARMKLLGSIPLDRLRELVESMQTEVKSPHPDDDNSILACPCCGSGEYLQNEDGNENHFCGQCGQRVRR